MKTIFNLILFAIAFIIGLFLIVSAKIIMLLLGVLFFALAIGIVVFVVFKIFLQSSDNDVNKNYKFTDDKRFKEKKEK